MHTKAVLAVAGGLVVTATVGVVAGMIAGDDEAPEVAGADRALDSRDASEEVVRDDCQLQVIVFLEGDITGEQRADLEAAIGGHPSAAGFTFFDQEESVAEFERLFANNPEMLDKAANDPSLITTSYRIIPTDERQETLDALVAALTGVPGVKLATAPPAGSRVSFPECT